ncbi:hypothetical protein D3C86_1269880 [compost metagenome]
MVLACHQREGGWQNDDICALVPQGAEQFREADIVANSATNRLVTDLIGHDLFATGHGIGFAIADAVRRIDVEQVNLAVPGNLLAIRTENECRIIEAVAFLLDDGAGVQRDRVLLC